MIVAILEDVPNWEALADLLEVKSDNIIQDCEDSLLKTHCYRRKLVNIYREKLKTDNKCTVASNIADALENMKMIRSAQKLRELYGELWYIY